ncbi:MAG: YceI family protein [Paraglaciecola sp.]|uniref:YceI family protein n=1 Tax=Paraglaciecola sp. TaxID=1920173 RepID=UPI003296EB4F
MKSLFTSIMSVVLFLFSFSANANWTLVNDLSSLNFVSTKNQHVSEIHHFKTLKGELSPTGKLLIEIDLTSIDSGIEIRDTRMREKLFVVDKFPTANLSAQLSSNLLSLEEGESILATLPAKLDLMGISKTIKVSVQVTGTANNGIIATSTQPILISAADFGLASGIEVLQKLAGLSGIGLTVPVSFNLLFNAD